MNTRPEIGFWDNLKRQTFGQGLLLHHGDDITAAVRAKREGISEEQALAEEYMKLKLGEEKYPTSTMWGQLVGSLIPTAGALAASRVIPGTTKLAGQVAKKGPLNVIKKAITSPSMKAKIGRGSLAGAGVGYLSHLGLEDKLNEAEQESWLGSTLSTGMGGVIGGGIPVIGKGAQLGIKFVKDRFARKGRSLDNNVLEQVFTAITNRGGTLQDVVNFLEANKSMGVPASISAAAATNPGLLKLAEKVMKGGKEGADILEEGLTRQRYDLRPRIEGTIRKTLSPKNFFDSAEEIAITLRTQASPLYEVAFKEAGIIDSPAITKLLKSNTKTIKKALERGQKLADLEYETAVLKYNHALDNLVEGAPLPIEPTKTILTLTEKPTLEVLDYIKRGLDAQVSRTFKKESAEAAKLLELKNQFVSILDDAAGPAYKKARQMWGSQKEIEKALKKGKKDFRSLDAKEITNYFNEATEGEKNAFIIGVGQNLKAFINESSSETTDYAGKIINSPAMKRRLEAIFPDIGPSGWNLLEAVLIRESQLTRKMNSILAIPPTTRRTSFTAEDTGILRGSIPAGLNMVFRWFQNAPSNPRAYKKIAELIMEENPNQVSAAFDSLADFANKAERRKQAESMRALGYSVTGAIMTPAGEGSDIPIVDPNEASTISIEEKVKKELESEDPYGSIRDIIGNDGRSIGETLDEIKKNSR